MTAKALCVGINQFANLPQASWLNGCVNDAEDMAAMLLKRPEFGPGDITVLTDAEATKAKVMAALKKLISDDVDHIVFSFSSHGTQVPDKNGDEEVDGVDEAFACYDIKERGADWDRKTVIVDDELKTLFETAGKDVLVEVVLDTCHSGSGLKALDFIPGRRPRFLPPPTPVGIRRLEPKSRSPKGLQDEVKKIPEATRPVLFAACSAAQVASDAPFGRRYNGAFTYYFLKALKGSKTRADVAEAVGKSLKDNGFTQLPQLEAVKKAKDVPFAARWN